MIDWIRRRFGKKIQPSNKPVGVSHAANDELSAANDNCFWQWIFGPIRPFETASNVRQLRRQILSDADYFPEDKAELIDHCDTFLALFHAIHIEKDEAMAESLAPKLNRHVPELMARCPLEHLRPE